MLTAMRDFSTTLSALRRALPLLGVLAASQALMPAAASAQPVPPEMAWSPALVREVQAWRICARLHLPPDFQDVRDSSAAVAVALEKCRRQRHVVAGRYALDYPGTFQTQAFVDGVQIQLMEELSTWLEDVHARRVSPHPPLPHRR